MSPDRVSSVNNLIQLIGALVIFAVMLLAIWLVLRWMGNIQKQQLGQRNLQLVESIRVGGNKFISVVRAGGAWYVVAVGKDEIRLLGELTEEQAGDFLRDKERSAAASADTFGNMLERVREQLPKKQDKA